MSTPLPSLDPIQHEVRPSAGELGESRLYLIEPVLLQDGYCVQIRRSPARQIVWRCIISFDTAADFQAYHGNVLQTIIEGAKADLDNEFIK